MSVKKREKKEFIRVSKRKNLLEPETVYVQEIAGVVNDRIIRYK